MNRITSNNHIPGEPLIIAPTDNAVQRHQSTAREVLTATTATAAYELPFALLMANHYLQNNSATEKIAAGIGVSLLLATGIVAVCEALTE